MRIAFCADVHIGNHKKFGGDVIVGKNQRCRDAIDVLERALRKAHEQECELFVVAGDLFDSVKPEPQIIAAVQQLFASWDAEGLSIAVVVGNHEAVSDDWGDHSVLPLQFVANVTKSTLVGPNIEMLYVPFHRKTGPATYLPKALDGCSKDKPICLVGHFGIFDDAYPDYLKGSSAIHVNELAKLLEGRNVRYVFAGDYHDGRIWMRKKTIIVQCGALCPTGFSDTATTCGNLWMVDTELNPEEDDVTDPGFAWMQIPGPRFLIGKKSDLPMLISTVTAMKNEGCKPYVKISCAPNEILEVKTAFSQLDVTCEIAVDNTEARGRAIAGASAARSTETLLSALRSYVSALNVIEGVDREVVFEKCRDFLGV